MTQIDKNFPVKLSLHNPAQVGGLIMDATPKFIKDWQRSIRSVGGYWIGYSYLEGSLQEKLDLFTNGLMYEIQENVGGQMTWQGFIAEMDLMLNGQTYRRSWSGVANRTKTVYSKIGQNMITNPGCETAAWDAYNTPLTREQSSTWASEGSYSTHVITDAEGDGVFVFDDLTVDPEMNYQGRFTVNVISGNWRANLYKTGGSVSDIVDSCDLLSTGIQVVELGKGAGNSEVTAITMNLFSVGGGGEIYADAAVFQLSPVRAETSWQDNIQSQSEYGIREEVLLKSGMSDDAALALTTRELARKSWATVIPPSSLLPTRLSENSLFVTFLGYAFTLSGKNTSLIGVQDEASNQITALVEESEFISVGVVENNSLLFRLDNREVYKIWDAIADITEPGDADGNRWECGVYNDRRLFYNQCSSYPVARVRNGNILDPGGGQIQGWFAKPGFVMLDDLPRAVDFGSQWEDTLKGAWMNEVDFSVNRWGQDGCGLSYTGNDL